MIVISPRYARDYVDHQPWHDVPLSLQLIQILLNTVGRTSVINRNNFLGNTVFWLGYMRCSPCGVWHTSSTISSMFMSVKFCNQSSSPFMCDGSRCPGEIPRTQSSERELNKLVDYRQAARVYDTTSSFADMPSMKYTWFAMWPAASGVWISIKDLIVLPACLHHGPKYLSTSHQI